MTNLPKQWEHWCRSMNFRPHGKVTKSKFCWYYLKGKGRVWRINCYNEFQRGDTYDDLDEYLSRTDPYTYDQTAFEWSSDFSKGVLLGDFVESDNVFLL